jgi:lipid II:glycine glycyltransferase (peptidoglycan interpeptide bridge formation enzyme)
LQDVCDQSAVVAEKPAWKPVLDAVWQVEVDCATSIEWSRMLDLFEDANLYQTWSYGGVRWGTKNLSHLILKRNDELVAMAQIRIIRPTKLKFGMAYLRWGPLCQRRGRELDANVLIHMARALHEEYVCKRRLMLQILPNAFVGSPRAEQFQSAFSGFTQGSGTSANLYRTFLVDLTAPTEKLRRNLDAKWRNKLSQGEKKGLKILAGHGTQEYRVFCGIYDQMRKRKSFETTVDVEEFGRIQEDLPERHRMRVLICEQEGVPVAGIVISALGDSAIYLLGATSDDGLNCRGAYVLQWTVIQWLKDNGFRWYDLGGIDPQANPGVYSFKRGLSGDDVFQLSPIVACDSVVSSVVVRASLLAKRVLPRLRNLRASRVRS